MPDLEINAMTIMTNSDHYALEKREVSRMAEQEKSWPQAERKMKGESVCPHLDTMYSEGQNLCKMDWDDGTGSEGSEAGPRGPRLRWDDLVSEKGN